MYEYCVCVCVLLILCMGTSTYMWGGTGVYMSAEYVCVLLIHKQCTVLCMGNRLHATSYCMHAADPFGLLYGLTLPSGMAVCLPPARTLLASPEWC